MQHDKDLRARLSPKGRVESFFDRGGSGYTLPFKGPGKALVRTSGIIFPFTPNITVSHQIDYSQYDLVHTNYQQNSYRRTSAPQIQIQATFASQTPEEAEYTVGVMHFLRVMSKMNFGVLDDDRGTPPPVLEFSAYGAYNFHRVPVLIGSFTFSYEDGVDYVKVTIGKELVQIPVMMMMAIDLLPQYSPDKAEKFNLDNFAQGGGYKEGFL
jgi:hypothetical protein